MKGTFPGTYKEINFPNSRKSAAARLLRSWVRNPAGAWMSVCCECCVLSGRGLCDGLITVPEESYRLWCVVLCDLETSWMRRPWPALGRRVTWKKNTIIVSSKHGRPLTTLPHFRSFMQDTPPYGYATGVSNTTYTIAHPISLLKQDPFLFTVQI